MMVSMDVPPKLHINRKTDDRTLDMLDIFVQTNPCGLWIPNDINKIKNMDYMGLMRIDID